MINIPENNAVIIFDAKMAIVPEMTLTLRKVEQETYVHSFGSGVDALDPYENIKEELIRAIKFTRRDGTSIWVGANKEIQELIGIHFEAWEELNSYYGKHLSSAQRQISILCRETKLSLFQIFLSRYYPKGLKILENHYKRRIKISNYLKWNCYE